MLPAVYEWICADTRMLNPIPPWYVGSLVYMLRDSSQPSKCYRCEEEIALSWPRQKVYAHNGVIGEESAT